MWVRKIHVQLTGTHVEAGATSERLADFLTCCQAEIGKEKVRATVFAQNILRLEVPMMNTHVVTVFHSGHDLKEDAPDEFIVPEV